jgi:hypothetical protein|tara:strand:+ start:992 stop:1405 length:414 start_codon:yes stop_codon:yes gene_type:complete
MAYGGVTNPSRGRTMRAVDYGYGLSEIQEAREAVNRNEALQKFQKRREYKDLARSLPGAFNKRGMIDSGLHKRGRERLEGARELGMYGLGAQIEEARRQLDKQRLALEEQFSGGLIDDEIAGALRRFGLAQSLKGLI